MRHTKSYDFVRNALESDDILIIGANIPYDFAVFAAKWPELMPLIFRAYDLDRVTDVQTRQKLIDIAQGKHNGWRNAATGEWIEYKYNLAALTLRHLGEDKSHLKSGPDIWRLRYKELHDVSLDEWPEGATSYAIGDAVDTLRVFEAQIPDQQFLEDEYRQARAHWALHLMSCRGIRTEKFAVDCYERRVQAELDAYRDRLVELKWVGPRRKTCHKCRASLHGHAVCSACGVEADIKRNVKVVQGYAIKTHPDCLKTPTGLARLDEEAVTELEDPDLIAYQKYSAQKTVENKIKELRQGEEFPIQTRFEVIVATGRSSSSKPNIQARSRKFGDRECFVPRGERAP